MNGIQSTEEVFIIHLAYIVDDLGITIDTKLHKYNIIIQIY